MPRGRRALVGGGSGCAPGPLKTACPRQGVPVMYFANGGSSYLRDQALETLAAGSCCSSCPPSPSPGRGAPAASPGGVAAAAAALLPLPPPASPASRCPRLWLLPRLQLATRSPPRWAAGAAGAAQLSPCGMLRPRSSRSAA